MMAISCVGQSPLPPHPEPTAPPLPSPAPKHKPHQKTGNIYLYSFFFIPQKRIHIHKLLFSNIELYSIRKDI